MINEIDKKKHLRKTFTKKHTKKYTKKILCRYREFKLLRSRLLKSQLQQK